MNAHEKLHAVMERVRQTFCNKGLGEIYNLLEIWLVDNHRTIASIRGKRVEIKTFFAWILKEGGISFLIGHEAYHFIKSIESQGSNFWKESLETIDKSNSSDWGKLFGYIVVSAIAFPLSRSISRTEELEADQFGKIITLETGYPLSDIDHLFSIREMRFSQGGGFLDTHPEYWERKRKLGLTSL